MDDRTRNLLLYLAKNHSVVTRTSLIKLAYLIDYVSTQNNGNKISEFNYIRYHFGPFDKKIYGYIDIFELTGEFEATPNFDEQVEYATYSVPEDVVPNMDLFTPQERESIDDVLRDLRGFGPKALTRIAYDTPPMKALGATLNNKEGLNCELDLYTKFK